MPCACKCPGLEYPENKEWGPFLWRTLHGLAERVGTSISALYEAEERRNWISVLSGIGTMLPCDECRDHYKEYLAAHSLKGIETVPKSELRTWIRTWLWSLHQDVNLRLGKTVEIALEDLPALYKGTNISVEFRYFDMIERKSITKYGVPILNYNTWLRHMRNLLTVYGLT